MLHKKQECCNLKVVLIISDKAGSIMKSYAWFNALVAHSRAHYDRGATVLATVGECAVVMGCTPQTVKKHMKLMINHGAAAERRVKKSGCIEQIVYEWTV